MLLNNLVGMKGSGCGAAVFQQPQALKMQLKLEHMRTTASGTPLMQCQGAQGVFGVTLCFLVLCLVA